MAEKFKKNKIAKKSPAKQSGKRTAIQATVFAITCVLLILVLTVVEFRPVKSVSAWGGAEESLALSTIAAKFFAAANQRKKTPCIITFSPAEVHALLNILQRIYANEKKPGDPSFYAVWNKGFSDTACSFKFAGVYWNFYLQITPSYSNGKLHLQIRSCRLGNLPLPAGTVEKTVNDELQRRISKNRKLQYALQQFLSLQAKENGELQIEILRKNTGNMLKLLL